MSERRSGRRHFVTTYAHPLFGEALDVSAIFGGACHFCFEVAEPQPSAIRVAHWPTWSHGVPRTVSYCDDAREPVPTVRTMVTAIDWSPELAERMEREAADRERAARDRKRLRPR